MSYGLIGMYFSVDKYGNLYDHCPRPDESRLHQVVADCNERKSWYYDNSKYVDPKTCNHNSWQKRSHYAGERDDVEICQQCFLKRDYVNPLPIVRQLFNVTYADGNPIVYQYNFKCRDEQITKATHYIRIAEGVPKWTCSKLKSVLVSSNPQSVELLYEGITEFITESDIKNN